MFPDVSGFANAQSGTYTNPVLNNNRPDPAILRVDEGFIVVTTSDHAQSGRDPALPIIISRDLINWEEVNVKHSSLLFKCANCKTLFLFVYITSCFNGEGITKGL